MNKRFLYPLFVELLNKGGSTLNIYTVGHSTHTEDEFLTLLNDAEIDLLVDVRAFPGSRKFPHFHKDRMRIWLPEAGIDYMHIEALGGRRNKSKTIDNDINDAWNNRSFHNYADYTLSEEFQAGITRLTDEAKNKKVAYCCSERHPSRCHRLIISNWLALHDWDVFHIIDGPKNKTDIVKHLPGKWGATPYKTTNGLVLYPESEQNI